MRGMERENKRERENEREEERCIHSLMIVR